MYQKLKKGITDNKVKPLLKYKEQRKFFSLFHYLVKKTKVINKIINGNRTDFTF